MTVAMAPGKSGIGLFRVESVENIETPARFENYMNRDMEILLQRKVSMKDRDVQILRDPEDGKIVACFKSLFDGSITPARTVGTVFQELNRNRDRGAQVELLDSAYTRVQFDEVELMLRLRGGQFQVVESYEVRKSELSEIGNVNIHAQAHRWARSKRFGAGIISGKEYKGIVRILCFHREFVDVRDATESELRGRHSASRGCAAKRWATDNNYFAGWLNGENRGNNHGVICLKDIKNKYDSSIFHYRSLSEEELGSSPDVYFDDPFHGWAVKNDYLTGLWDHEQSGGNAGIILIQKR